jgi:hypothetical protein
MPEPSSTENNQFTFSIEPPAPQIAVITDQTAYSFPSVSYEQPYTLLHDRFSGEEIAIGVGGKDHNQILFVKTYDKVEYRATEDEKRNPKFLEAVLTVFQNNPEMCAALLTFKDMPDTTHFSGTRERTKPSVPDNEPDVQMHPAIPVNPLLVPPLRSHEKEKVRE